MTSSEPEHLSDDGVRLLEALEKVVLHSYLDSSGLLTIGTGHLITKTEKSRGTIMVAGKAIPWSREWTREEVDTLRKQDVAWAEQDVEEWVKVPLTQHQFDALTCFVFNAGPVKFKASTLLELLNEGRYDEVPAQMMRWVYSKGKKVKGLTNRRRQEAALWGKS